ncbi:hypothetical protein ANO11243_035050 [Dothideomycetidae sp. 11243]|nr:hypothetical protein ANO11243_035050 [fungal sp. No.11243]
MDMCQAIGWNSLERTAADWKRLFDSVDKRLDFLGTNAPAGSWMSIIEARLEDDHGTGDVEPAGDINHQVLAATDTLENFKVEVVSN